MNIRSAILHLGTRRGLARTIVALAAIVALVKLIALFSYASKTEFARIPVTIMNASTKNLLLTSVEFEHLNFIANRPVKIVLPPNNKAVFHGVVAEGSQGFKVKGIVVNDARIVCGTKDYDMGPKMIIVDFSNSVFTCNDGEGR